MGYIDNFTGKVWDWTKPFQRTGKFPLDRSSMFASYEDALLYAKGDGSDSRGLGATSYIGQTITVWGPNEKGVEGVWVYSLIPTEKEGFAAELKTVGAGSATETATNYSAAKELSKTLVVGQLIKVANAEEIEETVEGKVVKNTYQAGFYIVEGAGVISALATSTGSDDEVGALKTRVTALETNSVKNSDFETYKAGVTSALDGKVSNTDFGAHAASGVSSADKALHVTSEEKVKWNNAEKYTDEEIAKLTTVYDAKGAAAQALADAKADAADKYQVKGNYEVAGTAASLNAAMDTRMTAVEGDVAELKAINHDAYKDADATLKSELQGAIDKVAGDLADEVTARGTLDTTLRGLISAETTARETAISGEASARETLDTTLRGLISGAQDAAEKVATDFNTAMDGRVAKLEAIDHEELMTDAINAWAKAESNDETVNTFKELVDYAATHKSEFTEIFGEVQGMKTSKADADALSQEVTDRKTADAELQGAINTEKSARETAIAEVNAEVAKKANQTDLDALNVLIGKASVEGGENGSGLVKRVEDLEAIDHDAYMSADATLKSELQGAIDKKAEKSALEALAEIVGNKDDKTGVFKVIDDLETYVSDHITDAENAIDKINSIEINGMAISTEGGIKIEGTNTHLGLDIERDLGDGAKETVYDTDQTIYEVLSNLSQRIDVLDPNVSGILGITSIMSGSGISVSTSGGQATVSTKVVADNFLKVGTNGLYVEIAVGGNDTESNDEVSDPEYDDDYSM